VNYLRKISTLQIQFGFIISKMKSELEEGDTASIVMTTCSTVATNTPTHTTATDDFWDHNTCRDAVPWAGETFMIRDRIRGRVITLKDGNLRLEANASRTGGWHWVCVEKNGWLGFRNYVSGTYIGHDGKGNFYAKVGHHEGHEFFCARRHPDGGYLLLMMHGMKFWKMDIGEDGNKLVETENEGTAWEFVKV
jgi:hypothetical protein